MNLTIKEYCECENKCWKAYKNILYWLRETLRVTVQISKHVDDDNGVYLTAVCYKVQI